MSNNLVFYYENSFFGKLDRQISNLKFPKVFHEFFIIKNTIIVACAICGVLCISLPIPIIVNNFNKFYEKAKIEEEIEAKRKKTSWEDAKRGNTHVSFARLIEGFLFYFCFIFINIFIIFLQNTHTYLPTHSQQKIKQQPFVYLCFFQFLSKKEKYNF